MFDSVIGQSKIKTFLSNEIVSDNLSYGYVFEADRFMGKEFIAQQFALELTTDIYISYVLPTEGRKNLSVEDIRNMTADAYSFTYQGYKKVYIIPNADEMNTQCQNAFLKTLEEPPQECVFVLLATNRSGLLETVRSRCMHLTFNRYSDSEIEKYLESKEVDFTPETIRLCNGTLNRYEFLTSKVFEEIRELSFRIVLHINELHNARIFAILKHLVAKKDNINDILDIFLIWYRDLYVYKLTEDSELVEFKTNISDIERIQKLYTEEQLLSIMDRVQFTINKLNWNCNFNMSIDTLLLYMKGVENVG